MISIPVKVHNVNVYPYIQWPPHGGIGPVIPPVITGASGEYAVGTLTTHIFYNLNLEGGNHNGKLTIHGQYTATGQYENGQYFHTTWLYCTEAGDKPEFGRTVSVYTPYATSENLPLSCPPYITLTPLTDITVSQLFPPPAVGGRVVITGASGHIIGTRTGTPHLMGAEVKGGERYGSLQPGSHWIIVTGKNQQGDTISLGNLTCCSAGDPAIFLQTWPSFSA